MKARRSRRAACVVAKGGRTARARPVLRHLTLAALALPGLVPCSMAADAADSLSFDYAHYEEGRRRLYGYNEKFAPLSADTLRAHGSVTLAPGWQAALDFTQDTWSGATPVTTLPLVAMSALSEPQLVAGASARPSTGQLTSALVDAAMRPYVNGGDNPFQPRYVRDERVIHMMTSASPETRKEGRGSVRHAWRAATFKLGGGVSDEGDYHARFIDASGEFEFDNRRSTLALAVSHSNASSDVTLPAVWLDWVDTQIGEQQGEIRSGELYADGTPRLEIDKNRRDWAFDVSLARVATRTTLLQLALGYRHGAGYLDNSYRVMSFLSRGDDVQRIAKDGSALYGATLYHSYEQRPSRRNQWSADLRLVQDVTPADAALHVDYRYYRDDWSVTAHTVALAWHQTVARDWSITPQLRWYSQSAANFYRPYVNCGLVAGYECALALEHYSSDYRLSAFGAVSTGLGVTRRFDKGVRLDVSGEYYLHRGGLGLGSQRAAGYGDFDQFLLHAGLEVDFDALATMAVRIDSPHDEGAHGEAGQRSPHHHRAPSAPAGVADGHLLEQAGQWMLGYRYMFASQSGDTLHGGQRASDADIVTGAGCDAPGCAVRAREMRMHMHMLELMVAPGADWSLMLMPQWVDMNMRLAPLAGGAPSPHSSHDHHETGGVGDLGVAALLRLFEREGHHLHAALGLSVPTGDAGIRLNPVAGHDHDPGTVRQAEYLHYGMQLGSGTWDLSPSVIYLGGARAWSWGARVGLTTRLGQRNREGYAWGDKLESSLWLGREVLRGVTLSLRGLVTVQGRLKGRFDPHRVVDVASDETRMTENSVSAAMDSPASYGGRYYDLGIGLRSDLPSRWLAGSQLAVEWLQPVSEAVHGYQLERDGALALSWSVMF